MGKETLQQKYKDVIGSHGFGKPTYFEEFTKTNDALWGEMLC